MIRDRKNFELDRNENQFELFAIKEFGRSAADKIMDDPNTIRPPIVLYNTVKYMRDVLMDQDQIPPGQSSFKYRDQKADESQDLLTHSFADIHSILMDRFRQISQDLHICNQKPSKYSIGVYENMIRYTVIV